METRRAEAPRPELEEAATLFAAGDLAIGEFRCFGCGYGVSVRAVLPKCPMCHGLLWEEAQARQPTRFPL
jgi:rubrerythrin